MNAKALSRLFCVPLLQCVFLSNGTGKCAHAQSAGPPHLSQKPAALLVDGDQTHAAVPILIGPGDLLDMSVVGEPDLSKQVRVGADGTADIAMLGSISVAGLTAQQASEAIARELRGHNLLLHPQVNVVIKEFATQGVSVLGEVQHPGIYDIPGARTLLEVLSMAGGLTANADAKASVRHRNGKLETVPISLRVDDSAAGISQDRQIFPGDLIVIARAGVVYILGEVTRPGGFVMQDSGHITVLELLSQAGGANKLASLDKSVLLRKTPHGYSETAIHVKQIVHGRQPDPELQPNDIVFVPNSKLKSAARSTQDVAAAVETASIYAVFH